MAKVVETETMLKSLISLIGVYCPETLQQYKDAVGVEHVEYNVIKTTVFKNGISVETYGDEVVSVSFQGQDCQSKRNT